MCATPTGESKMKLPIVFLLLLSGNAVICFEFSEEMKKRFIAEGKTPDMFRNVSELISSNGYPVENYIVQTNDGYLLPVERIPYGVKNSNRQPNKPVVFLQHATLLTSACWVWNSPEKSLGFILADEGYDVWMGNWRGNTYARKHVTLNPNMRKFWDFSFDEMVEYDLPKMLDFVLNKTGQKKISYIGHSLGTVSAFALLSQRQQYNKKINIFIAFAPVISFKHIQGTPRLLLTTASNFYKLLDTLGVHEVLSSNALIKQTSVSFCDGPLSFTCAEAYYSLLSRDEKEMDKKRMGVYFANAPAGTSLKLLAHFGQLVKSGIFRKFDYGLENHKKYNQATPPEYDVSKITAPVAIFHSDNDNMADPEDVQVVRQKVKTIVDDYRVPDPKFNHGDFVWAINAPKLIYKEVLTLLQKYS